MTVQPEGVYSNVQHISSTGSQHEFTMHGFNGMVSM